MTGLTIVKGDNCRRIVRCIDEDGAVDLSTATAVKAALVAIDHRRVLAGPYTCASGDPAAAFAAGDVSILFLGADTQGLCEAQGVVEIQATFPDETRTFFTSDAAPWRLVQGLIP